MNLMGWTLMLSSLICVWTLAVWCYWKILSSPDRSEERRECTQSL